MAVPEAHREAAEEVRAFLVSMRGGAPFLSPKDTLLLVDWLEAGVSVAEILRAIERVAEAREKKPSRLPFTLVRAKAHLGKPTSGRLPAPPPTATTPLGPLLDQLRAITGPEADAVHALAEQLAALPTDDNDALFRAAMRHVRAFLDGRWEALDEAERARRLRDEMAAYADLKYADEDMIRAGAEEAARRKLRADHPLLTAATLWDLIAP